MFSSMSKLTNQSNRLYYIRISVYFFASVLHTHDEIAEMTTLQRCPTISAKTIFFASVLHTRDEIAEMTTLQR